MEIRFTEGNWERYFDYAYTRRFPDTPKFRQEPDCIVNADKRDFTSIFLKEPYTAGAKISFTASFDAYGAPLLVIAKDLIRGEKGELWYGDYQEVVLWENGVNVWDFWEVAPGSQPECYEKGGPRVQNGICIDWLLSDTHPLEAGKRHRLTVELDRRRLKIWVNEHYVMLRVPNLPEKAYLGITGCEGINRFYDLTVDP